MSNNIRRYRDIPGQTRDKAGREREMAVTAFVGREKYGYGIQFTMGNHYFKMSEEQVRDLIRVLEMRLALTKGYSATTPELSEEPVISNDGVMVAKWL